MGVAAGFGGIFWAVVAGTALGGGDGKGGTEVTCGGEGFAGGAGVRSERASALGLDNVGSAAGVGATGNFSDCEVGESPDGNVRDPCCISEGDGKGGVGRCGTGGVRGGLVSGVGGCSVSASGLDFGGAAGAAGKGCGGGGFGGDSVAGRCWTPGGGGNGMAAMGLAAGVDVDAGAGSSTGRKTNGSSQVGQGTVCPVPSGGYSTD